MRNEKIKLKSIHSSFIIALAFILIGVNSLYYFSTRDNLKKNQEEKVELIIDNVRSSINSSINTERYFNSFLAKDLYKSAIAIQNALPPDIKDVTTDELEVLKEELGLEGITLFVQKGDDVVSVMSSNPNEVGLSSEFRIGEDWHEMFQQLLTVHNVTLHEGFGESLPNFWSGPINTSVTDPTIITKFGYYNDGTTNYLINPIIESELVEEFYQTAGVEKVIKQVKDMHPFLLNVSVVNGDVMRDGEKITKETGNVRFADRLFLAGRHLYPVDNDKEYAGYAIKTNELVHQEAVVNGTKVIKTYFPSEFKTGYDLTDRMLITATTDYDAIRNELNDRTLKIALISLLCFIFGFVSIYISIRLINRKQRTIFNVQEMYTQHVDSLFNTMKEYQHDFNHHLYTIAGLSSMGLHNELEDYVSTLVSFQDEVNDLVDVNIPALSGLIQSKKSEAREKDIVFEHHFENLETLNLSLEKVTDIVKVTGNIMENAFHAVEESEITSKRVTIYGKYQDSLLTIIISNNGNKIPENIRENIFKSGFTTRTAIGGTGVGLASSNKAVERYRGTITVTSDEHLTTFVIKIPISKKEIHDTFKFH